jgi:hypothetical protein
MREEVGRTTLECQKTFMVKGKKEERRSWRSLPFLTSDVERGTTFKNFTGPHITSPEFRRARSNVADEMLSAPVR